MAKENLKIYKHTSLKEAMFASKPEYECARVLQRMLRIGDIGDQYLTYNKRVKIDNDVSAYRKIDFIFFDRDGNEIWLEYNGYQHYGLCPINHYSQIELDAQMHRDRIVRKHAYRRNILMIVIGTKHADEDITNRLNLYNINATQIFNSMKYVGKAKYIFNHKVCYK